MQGAEAVLLGRGTTIPLSPTSHCPWKRNVDKIFVETQTGVYTWKYHPAHVHSLYGIPALHPPPPHIPNTALLGIHILEARLHNTKHPFYCEVGEG